MPAVVVVESVGVCVCVFEGDLETADEEEEFHVVVVDRRVCALDHNNVLLPHQINHLSLLLLRVCACVCVWVGGWWVGGKSRRPQC